MERNNAWGVAVQSLGWKPSRLGQYDEWNLLIVLTYGDWMQEIQA